jgi:hypothetical protein
MPSVPLEEGGKCRWCGEDHAGLICPWVKALEFTHGDERVTRVEFVTAADFPKQQSAGEPENYPRLKPIPGG